MGWGAAAIAFWAVYAVLPPEQAWRVLFWLGILPAFLIFYIRRNIKDPEVFQATQAKKKAEGGGNFWEIFSPRLLKTTILASLLSTGMMGAYYAVTTWLPTFLKVERSAYLGIRLDYLYSIYVVFSVGVIARYAALTWRAIRGHPPDIEIGAGSAL